MQSNRGRDTKPELAIRSAVHRRGLRFRVDAPPVPSMRRTADLVFRPTRVAVFVDGCFWHGCPVHGTRPVANAAWWAAKLDRNAERDAETTKQLEALGWMVLRFWEHDDPEGVADIVEAAVRSLM